VKFLIDAAPGEAAARAGELLKAIAADLAPASAEARVVLEALEHAEDEARAARPMRDEKLEALRVKAARIVGQELRALREDVEGYQADAIEKADPIEKGIGDWLKKRIARTWQRIRARVFGAPDLTDAEREAIGPIPAGEEPVVEVAFRDERGSDEPLNDEERLVLAAARERAGELITGLAERHGDEAAKVLEDVRAQVGASIEARDVPKVLAANLREVASDRMRDWDRVAVTELQAAKNEGRIAAIKRTSDVDDPIVFKTPAPSACSHCVRLHVGPDGLPRLFLLSTLDANNAGRKKADWRAVRGPVHPGCSCTLASVPRGWGFDADGDLVPGGKLGTVYDGEDAIAKALEGEDAIQRAALVGASIDFQGIPITIEANAGDVRRWRCPRTGKAGRTVLRFAYGEIPGTCGVDGDPIDVYVGPDPTSPIVFAVDQLTKITDLGALDEQKIMLGFRSEAAARAAYLAHYPASFYGGIHAIDIDAFRESLSVGVQFHKGDDLIAAERDGNGFMDRSYSASGGAALTRKPRRAKPSGAMKRLIDDAKKPRGKRKIVDAVRLHGPTQERAIRSAIRPRVGDPVTRANEAASNLERVREYARARRGHRASEPDAPTD